jgi:hypothetical protein
LLFPKSCIHNVYSDSAHIAFGHFSLRAFRARGYAITFGNLSCIGTDGRLLLLSWLESVDCSE